LRPDLPIGIFDSGVGGLTVYRALHERLPNEHFVYLGDTARVPYGTKSLATVERYAVENARFLEAHGIKLLVVACNTASAAALKYLRATFPGISFVGMEPAIKPAAETTKTGRVGVLATPATFQGALYASVVERFGAEVELFQHTCPGLVGQIEKGDLDSSATRTILENALNPMLDKNIDTVVLGCTHYPFVIPLIEQIVGENVRVIDPAPSVARQVRRLLEADGMKNQSGKDGRVRYITSGDGASMKSMLTLLLETDGEVESVTWKNDREIQ